jgi:hypothetical protein
VDGTRVTRSGRSPAAFGSGGFLPLRGQPYVPGLRSGLDRTVGVCSDAPTPERSLSWQPLPPPSHLFVVFYEEPTLRKKFGADYEEYCRNVRRWWPRYTSLEPTAIVVSRRSPIVRKTWTGVNKFVFVLAAEDWRPENDPNEKATLAMWAAFSFRENSSNGAKIRQNFLAKSYESKKGGVKEFLGNK